MNSERPRGFYIDPITGDSVPSGPAPGFVSLDVTLSKQTAPGGPIDTHLSGPEAEPIERSGPTTFDDSMRSIGRLFVDTTAWVNHKLDELMLWLGLDPEDADLRGRFDRGVTSAHPRQHPYYRRAARGTKQWDRKRTARLRRDLIAEDMRRLDREALDA